MSARAPGLLDATDRAALLAEIERQNAPFSGEARRASIAALREGAEVVVTGQQVGLFSGPAYAIYKAATAIFEARARGAVPVFWLQLEDHDAEEVGACHVIDAAGVCRSVNLHPEGVARSSLAHRRLGAGVTRAVDDLAKALDEAPHRDETLAGIRAAYRPDRTWGEAFATLLASLFEELVFFDPRTPAVAALARPVHRWAIDQAEAIDALLGASTAAQVPLRPGCLLSFFHPEGPEGPRFRPTREGNANVAGYGWPGASRPAGRDDLIAALEREPLNFSTSALLRPILQDHLLPTAAYVGGPSELRYLEQVQPLYDAREVARPPAVPRARFVVTDPRSRRRLARLGLDARDFERSEQTLLDRLAPAESPSGTAVRDTLAARFRDEVARFREEIPDLARDFDRTERHLARGLARLADRVDAARRRRDDTLAARLSYLTARLRPDGQLQERRLGFAHFAAWHGPRTFVEATIEGVRADRSLQELALWS